MRIAIVYVYPMNGERGHDEKAHRFVKSYAACPPLADHVSIVVCNGLPADAQSKSLFHCLPGLSFAEHDNSGFDVGAYQMVSQRFVDACDLMVFLGASTYFKRPGWLVRIAESYVRHGDTLYGATADLGNLSWGIFPHIRTTAFWMTPRLFNAYPIKITEPSQRYPFEHGPQSLTYWIFDSGKTPWMTTWSGEYTHSEWGAIPNGYHNGDQSDILIGDRMTANPHYPVHA